MENDWYSIPKEELLQKLSTSAENGLTNKEINERYQKYGLNELQKGKKISF